MYHIIGYQTNPITGETQYQILCDTAADLPSSPVSDNGYGGEIGQGSKAVIIADGCSYIADSNRNWIYQPNPNAWANVYTKLEIDEMITEIYETIAYYHTTLVSDTGEITFYALDGYIGTWTIFGNGQQTVTPSPQNIIMPDLTGKRTANLWDEDYTDINVNLKYVPVFVGDGTFTLSTDTPDYSRNASLFLLSGNVTSGASTPTNGVYNGISRTTDSSNGYITIAFRRQSEETNPVTHKTMLNRGSTALPYEPYGYKIQITCAGQTTPVYLGQTQTVRKIRKLVLDGTENWQEAGETGHIQRLVLQGYARVQENIPVSTHYKGIAPVDTISNIPNLCTALLISSSGDNYFYINDENCTSVGSFKAYLAAQYAAGTPVTVWYVLAEPQAAIVNEPLCKIGTYFDELHSADAGVAIPTVKGENTLTVDTILKPSRIEIQG